MSAQPFDELGKTGFLVQIVDQVRLLILPGPPRRRVPEGHFTAGLLLDGDAAFENGQAGCRIFTLSYIKIDCRVLWPRCGSYASGER